MIQPLDDNALREKALFARHSAPRPTGTDAPPIRGKEIHAQQAPPDQAPSDHDLSRQLPERWDGMS